MPLQRNSVLRGAFALLFLLGFAPLAYAAAGTISPPNQYAWGNIAAWINFAPASSTITVSGSSLTGYAWSENDGWINLSPTEGGVTNNGSGALGGWAWDQSAGWVSFSGVTIDSAGTFHGEATGADGYAINFDCSTCDVQTSWHPMTATTNTTASSPGAISPIAPVAASNTSIKVITSPPSPPPNEAIPGASASTAHATGGSHLQLTPLPSSVANTATLSVTPRASAASRSSTKGAPPIFVRVLQRIALPVAGVLFLAILAAVFWFLL